jgi:lysozyme
MKYSQNGLRMTETFEGLRLNAYLDGGGVPTIGYGHTHDVKLGDTCTQEQAEQWLEEDIASSEYDVNRLVKVDLTQDQFDALVDFVFNLGASQFARSTLLLKLNLHDYKGAAAEFKRWCFDNGKVVAGLVKRRAAEEQLFRRGTT